MNTDLIQPEPMKEDQLEYLKKMNINIERSIFALFR